MTTPTLERIWSMLCTPLSVSVVPEIRKTVRPYDTILNGWTLCWVITVTRSITTIDSLTRDTCLVNSKSANMAPI